MAASPTQKRLVIGAIIEARMGSSRLPGKVLMKAAGKPMLQHLVERLQRAKKLQKVMVATSVSPKDQAIEDLCRSMGIPCFRGSEEDVLDRVLQAAHSEGLDAIVEITGDCPLMDPQVVDDAVTTFLEKSADFFGNRNVNPKRKTYPDGFGVRVFSTKALAEAAQLTNDPADREHVSIFISDRPEKYKLVTRESGLPEKYWPMRFTLDTVEDLELIKKVIEALIPQKPEFTMLEILQYAESNPDLLKINAHVQEKAIR